MNNNIRKRIDELKEKNGFKNDSEIISAIFQFKKKRGRTGKTKEFEFIEKNKGSYSRCFNGLRNFKLDDYLAVEYVLNTSMAYIIEGKGEISKDFQPCGIRYAAYTDTPGNYEKLMEEDIVNCSDEYNKMLIDYMIEQESKNGFIYFAERDYLPLTNTGGKSFDFNCLHYSGDNKKLLIILCKLLPVNLLKKYFDGFLNYQDIYSLRIDDSFNTSFTDDVIGSAIKRDDLRTELCNYKKMNLDTYNRVIRFGSKKSFGEGLFVNYSLTVMLKYALTHDIEDEIRIDLLDKSIKVNKTVLDFSSTFSEEELKIDKYGFITNKFSQIYYGSIVIPSECSVEISNQSSLLLAELNGQVHDFHEIISKNSQISIFANEIYADKKNNFVYYDFFKLMNSSVVNVIPIFKENTEKEKDLFVISNSEKSRVSNRTDEDLTEIVKEIRKIDDISTNKLNGMTYYLVNPTIYMLGNNVNYIVPRDVKIDNKYSNLVFFINDNVLWSVYETRPKTKLNNFIKYLKLYGLDKDELGEFIENFISISEKQSQFIDKTNDIGKDLALKMLENKSWVEIYRDDILKNF